MGKEKIKYIPTTDRNVKCSYCGKQAQFYSDDTFSKAYCSKKCEKLHSIALDKIKRNMKWFYIGIAISVLLLLSGAVWNFSIDKKIYSRRRHGTPWNNTYSVSFLYTRSL